MSKIQLLLLSVGFLSLISCDDKAKEDQHPNIIFILADDLGYGDISAFNEDGKIQTPNIDQLAADGMKFTDAHTSSSVCTPTRYGIMTGRYNWRSTLKQGVLTGNSKALIPQDRTTVASMLQEQGYHTSFIGKWHLGWDWALKNDTIQSGAGWNPQDFDNIDFTKPITNSPNSRGFDYAYGHSGSLDMAPYVYVENENATAIPDTVTVNKGKYSWWREGPTSPDFIHEDVTQNFFRKAIAKINENANKEKPFFMYLALPSPHTPILPSEKWQGKSGLNPYADFVLMIDEYMGLLTNAVKENGIDENTMIIFTSDNGCSPAAKMGEMTAKGHFPSYKFRGHKADIFEGGHRVPFIVKWPRRIEAGQVSDTTICTTDFFATCADITSYEIQDTEAEDSYGFLPILENEPESFERKATIHHSINGSFAIRKDHWKLILCPGSGGWSNPKPNDTTALQNLPMLQLYDLRIDPGEKTNLQASNPEVVTALRQEVEQIIMDGRSTPGIKQINDGEITEWKQLTKLLAL